MRRLAVSLALLVPALSPAADVFEVKLRKRAQGDFIAVSFEEKTTNALTVSSPEGKVLNTENTEVVESAKYKEELLEKEAGKKPTKLRRTYEKATMTVGGKAQEFAYSGKAITVQRLTAGYVFTFDDGKPLVGEAAGLLPKEFTTEKSGDETIYAAVLPKKPVAVGAAWPVAAKDVLKEIAGETADKAFDLTKAKGTGKLTKAYKKDDKQFGVLEIELSAPLTVLPDSRSNALFKCRAGSAFTMTLVFDACIDGTAESGTIKGEAKFAGTADVTASGKEGDRVMKFEWVTTRTDTQEPVKK